VTQPTKWSMAWLGLMLLCACAPDIVVNYDKSADFSRYRTYGWGKNTPAKNPNLDQQIVQAIDDQLARKGLAKTESDPDLLISYHAASHEEIDYTEASYASGMGPAYGSAESTSASSTPMRVKVGTVIVDMYDPKTKRNVWQGAGSGLLGDDQGKMSGEIHKGAAKMFEKFPPSQ